jgi:hypothetical protein
MQTNAKKLLTEWGDEVSVSLVEGFRHLFESSSQVLLDFADSAENNRLQRLFFDAQREFYLKEEVIVNEFERALRDRLLSTSESQGLPPGPGSETLSLVEKDDFERSLALETIAKRVATRNKGQLHALSQRLSALSGGSRMTPEQVPAHPMQIVRLFDPASRKLDVEKEVRLVFYTLFDRYVMSRLGDLYDAMNERLAALGILPNIRYSYERRPASSAAAGPDGDERSAEADPDLGPTAQQGRPAPPTSAQTLAAISSLLMEKRRHQRQASEPSFATSAPILASAADVREAITDMRVLEEAPHPLPITTSPLTSKVEIDAQLLLKIKKALEKQRYIIKNLVGRDRLETKDEDVIDIVGMLFEAMLNEKLLPNAVKTLLSHLHTRYLKIAVQSPDFLENNAHPARQLFERMIDSGIRWVREDSLRAGIYPTLQAIVMQILQTEASDDAFFSGLSAELKSAEQKLEKQYSATEGRTLESERGRARLEQAKTIVAKTIETLIDDNAMAETVSSFLSTTFADYLTLLLLRNDLNTGSDAWREAQVVGEALVAAAVHAREGTRPTEDMRHHLKQRLLTTVGTLIPHHEDNINRVINDLDAPAVKPKPAAKPRIASTSDGETVKQEDQPTSAEEQALADKLMRQTGNWFVLKISDKEQQSVKLLWVNPHTRNMLFVDQQGAKVALMPATTLARKIRAGEIRPQQTESSSFIARSLRRIRRALEDSISS